MIIATKAKDTEILSFIDKGSLTDIDDLDILTDRHKEAVSKALTDVSGVDYGYLPCLGSVYGEVVNIVNDGDTLGDIFDLRVGDFILQLDKGDSYCYTICFSDLLELVNKFPKLDDDNRDIFCKRFVRRLNPTDNSSDILIAFIPNITKEDVKLYTYLDDNRISNIIDTSDLSPNAIGDTLKDYMNLF